MILTMMMCELVQTRSLCLDDLPPVQGVEEHFNTLTKVVAYILFVLTKVETLLIVVFKRSQSCFRPVVLVLMYGTEAMQMGHVLGLLIG